MAGGFWVGGVLVEEENVLVVVVRVVHGSAEQFERFEVVDLVRGDVA